MAGHLREWLSGCVPDPGQQRDSNRDRCIANVPHVIKSRQRYPDTPCKRIFQRCTRWPDASTGRAITINIKVVDIIDQQHFAKFQSDLYAKRKGFQKAKDAKAIEKYLADKKITAQTDTSGIRYVIHTTTGGAKPTPNSCVEVAYEGKFLKDEKTFDKNPKMAFSLNQVIPGWKQSIPMLGIGDSATFYIPSHLAYGPQGYPGAIPPNAILIFDVKLFATGENYDPQTRSCK